MLPAIAVTCLVACLMAPASFSQTPEPQREQLLNGLRILLLNRPGDANVLLKLRINSGAAFDPAGKAGTMALLGDILFPDAVTRDYFSEEMGGRLEVETDFDAINITLQGRAAEYDRIVDVLRAALVTTLITQENVNKVREARIKALGETRSSASEAAHRAIALRLFDSFPYANSTVGTLETVGRIERSDLMLAREKFLSPDNATLVIIGGVDQRRAMRALRQLLGGWRKSDQLVPATFRQPPPPDPRTLIADFRGTPATEVRLATRGIARGDRDFFAAELLTAIALERWQKQLPDLKGSAFVRQEAHLLPGMFVMGATVDSAAAVHAIGSARQTLESLVNVPVSPAELASARNKNAGPSAISANESLANAWLDIEAYALPSLSEQARAWNSLVPSDLQRVATRLFKEAALASAAVGNAEDLKSRLAPLLKIEVQGESAPKALGPQPTKPADAEPAKQRTVPTFKPLKPTNPLMKSNKPTTKPG